MRRYICAKCGKEHEEWPALAYDSPANYNELTEKEKEEIAELSADFCVIRYEDQTDRFIRVTLTQKVIDHCEDLEYGFWVSLSEKSFDDYSANFNNSKQEARYFGWLCNNIPEYDFNESIPTTVFTRLGNERPFIVPYKGFDHPFVHDFYNGISKVEAERRIENMLRIIIERDDDL